MVHTFTVPLHSPNGRHLPAVRAVQSDCHWGLKNGRNSHWSRDPIIQRSTRQSQSIFRPTNHKRVMPGGHVSYPTDSPIASRLRLWSSLWTWSSGINGSRFIPMSRKDKTWWRHQMETFPALLALCAGNTPVTGVFPSQRPVTRSFDIFFDMRLNKTVEETTDTPVVWDVIALIMASLQWKRQNRSWLYRNDIYPVPLQLCHAYGDFFPQQMMLFVKLIFVYLSFSSSH